MPGLGLGIFQEDGARVWLFHLFLRRHIPHPRGFGSGTTLVEHLRTVLGLRDGTLG